MTDLVQPVTELVLRVWAKLHEAGSGASVVRDRLPAPSQKMRRRYYDKMRRVYEDKEVKSRG